MIALLRPGRAGARQSSSTPSSCSPQCRSRSSISRLPISIDGIGVYEGIFIGIMTLGGVRPEDSLAISLAARALQIVVWLPWWLMLVARTGALGPPPSRHTRCSAPPSRCYSRGSLRRYAAHAWLRAVRVVGAVVALGRAIQHDAEQIHFRQHFLRAAQ